MSILTNIPIKRKLTLVILITSTAGLLAATLALFMYQLITFRQTFIRDIDVLSEIIAKQSGGPLSFGTPKEASELLAGLQAKSYVVSAVIEAKDGTEFGRFGTNRASFKGMSANSSEFVGRYHNRSRDIEFKGEVLGTFYLRTDYQEAFNRIVQAHVGILAGVLIGSVLLTLALSTRLQRVISDPILRLAETAKSVAQNKDYSARAAKVGSDELGLFTEAFNQMLSQIQTQDTALRTARAELENQVSALQHEIAERERAERQLEIAHRELLEASRRAGMAEVATGVLHNVGNVLNSVNVSTILLRDTARKSEVATVNKLAILLDEHKSDLGAFLTTDPRGCQVPRFLTSLAGQLTVERSNMLSELDLLAKNIEHIKNIVAMQQNYASVAGFVERVELDGLVKDALEINAAALVRHGVQATHHFESAPPLFLDKHKVLQVLVNLIQNAKYAMEETGQREKLLTLSIRLNEGRSVAIIVQDNGVGIASENLTRIFGHGFTTRKEGHGFGLHSSALAAREMGGELKAYSEGLGKGATFILELPLSPKEKLS